MARALLGTVVAAAVLYHTVAGCCAHHDHRAVFGQVGMHTSSGACCRSVGEASHRHHGDRHADHDHGTPPCSDDCPVDLPSQHSGCQHGSCVFAVPNAAGSVLNVSPIAGDWLPVAPSGQVAGRLAARTVAASPFCNGTLLLPGPARRHLALGVMLL